MEKEACHSPKDPPTHTYMPSLDSLCSILLFLTSMTPVFWSHLWTTPLYQYPYVPPGPGWPYL